MTNNKLKYVYCVPHIRGFNDILCTIANCLNYCRKYDRILLLDTFINTYKINLIDYFIINCEEIIIDKNMIENILLNDDLTYYPVKSINAKKYLTYCNNTMRFDLESEYDEDVLIYSDSRGFYNSGLDFLKYLKMIPNTDLYNILHNRLSQLNSKYVSIHIRNTDYQSNYIKTYDDNKLIIENYPKIFLATDSMEVFKYFKSLNLQLISFTKLPEINEPLHDTKLINSNDVFVDMFCDLILLGMSDKIILPDIYYGFSRLALQLNENKKLLSFIIN